MSGADTIDELAEIASKPASLQTRPSLLDAGSTATADGGTGETESDASTGQAGPAPSPAVRVELIGTSILCKVRPQIAADGRSVSLQLEDFSLDQVNSGKYCRFDAVLQVPTGHAVTLEGAAGWGAAELPEGATAMIQSDYDFSRSTSKTPTGAITELTGPLSGPFSFKHDYPAQKPSVCGEDSISFRASLVLHNTQGKPAHVSVTSLELARFKLTPCTLQDADR